jgi:hypothetical protein
MTMTSPLLPLRDHPEPETPLTLTALLAAIRPRPEEQALSLGDILSRIGQRSFAASLLVLALLMVSPLSAIPFLPSVVAIIIVMIAGQAVLGRHHLWLPSFVMRREISAHKLRRALDGLGRAAAWIDARRSGRWVVLTQQPIASLAYLMMMVIALTWPPLSFVPFSATLGAIGLAMLAAGQTLRDGIFVMFGYGYLGLLVTGVSMAVAGVL